MASEYASEIVEVQLEQEVQTTSMDELESSFNIFMEDITKETQNTSSNLQMNELEEIGQSIIDAQVYLSSFSKGEKMDYKQKAFSHLSNMPLIGNYAKKKIEDIKETNLKNSSVVDVVNKMFNDFEDKKKKLYQLTDTADAMQKNMKEQEVELLKYIKKLDYIVQNTAVPSEKLRALSLSSMAEVQQKQIQELVYNRIAFIMELNQELIVKLSKVLPTMKNQLLNETSIAAMINAIKDTIEMTNGLQNLTNEIAMNSSEKVGKVIIEGTKMLSNNEDQIKFLETSQKRNIEYHKDLASARKEHITKTVEQYAQIKNVNANNTKMLEQMSKDEAELLQISLEKTLA